MNRNAIAAVAAIALTTAACGRNDEAATDVAADPGMTAGASEAVAPPAPMSPGQAFADTAATSDMFEIETSRLAETRASSAKVKSFAAQMIKAHTDSSAKLKAAAASASPAITPASALSSEQQAKIDALSAMSGAEFDRAYAAAQVEAHEATLATLRTYSANGDVPSLKSLAAGMVPIVTAHVNMAKGL